MSPQGQKITSITIFVGTFSPHPIGITVPSTQTHTHIRTHTQISSNREHPAQTKLMTI